MTRNEFQIKQTENARDAARVRYIKACEWLGRNLKRAADQADFIGNTRSVDECVMSSSLVQDITRAATEYRMLGEQLVALRQAVEEEVTS
jgi:hypothetical protein